MLPLLVSLMLLLTSCATTKLWSKANYDVYESAAIATGLEIYGESPPLLRKNDLPEVIISFTAAKNIIAKNSRLPSPEGCIIFKHLDDSLEFLVSLESLLHAIPRSKIMSVKAVISHRSYRRSGEYNFRLGVALQPVDNDLFDSKVPGKPKVNSSWSPLLKRPTQGVAQKAEKYSKSRRYTPLDSYIIPDNSEKDILYFLIGGFAIAQLVSNNECVINDNFIPLLQDDKIPFTIQFVEGEKAMEFPLGPRIILTPFTVAFDVITFPIQALLVVIIGSLLKF